MYVAPEEDQSRYQAKLIVNMVVVVFLIIGLLLVMQYFNFIYLREIPVIGNWLMGIYERVFGVPRVLILHGGPDDGSIGDWTALRDRLSARMVFYSEDIDVSKFSAGVGQKLNQYGLVIVEDVRRLDKDKLINLKDYVEGGGNIIWVADAGTQGYVEYDDIILANQTGWSREVVCIDEITKTPCLCKTVKANSTCQYHPDSAERFEIDLTPILRVTFVKNSIVVDPELEIIDTDHWSVAGIKQRFDLEGVDKITLVSSEYSSALVANVNALDESYPALIVYDNPGSWGQIVYFSYPPEETMEIVMPLVERMRY
jgi:hypothetical protein